MRLIQNGASALALALCLLVGIVTLVNFAANVRAINLLDHAFWARTDWHQDFDSTTQLMLARAIWHHWGNTELMDSDFYKLTGLYCFANNLIVIVLALTEVVLLNYLVYLRQISKLVRNLSTFFFCTVALITPVILLLTTHIGGF